MSDFREMPFVTVEQIVRMREAAMLECAQLSQQTWKQDEEIDRLRAEVASLKMQNDDHLAAIGQLENDVTSLKEERDNAEERREVAEDHGRRLHKALLDIVKNPRAYERLRISQQVASLQTPWDKE